MTVNSQRAIRSALHRLGAQAPPERVVEELESYGIEVSEYFVNRVRMQIHRDAAKATRERSKRPPKTRVRWRPQRRKIPGR